MKHAALLFVACALAQAPPQPFRTGVDAVRVDVLVTEGNRPVAGLAASDFELRDNGVRQAIDAVAIEDVSLSMMLVLDVSTSVRGGLDDLKEAALAALDSLQPEDRAALVTFSEEVQLLGPWTGRHEQLAAAVSATTAGGGTALFDAVYGALTLRDDEPGRRALVLIFSDGADTASWLPDSVVAAKAQRTEAVVYAVAFRDGPRLPPTLMFRSGIELMPGNRVARTAHEFLNEVADLTGGAVYTAENTRAVQERFAEIVREFRTRYLLTYTPRRVAPDGWHRIDVSLKNRSGKVRARRGYSR